MNPIESLKSEHVLIIRMNRSLEYRLRRFRTAREIDPDYVLTAVDFIRSYADLCHHGKEEGILFRELEKKSLEPAHAALMTQLVQEHQWARATTRRLAESNAAYSAGKGSPDEADLLQRTLKLLSQIHGFYPGHITKEESRFFNPCLAYFSQEEIEAMQQEFAEYDRNLVHEKYRRLVETFEAELEDEE